MAKRERKPHWLGRTNGGEMPDRLTFIGISSELVSQSPDGKCHLEHGRMADWLTLSYRSEQPEQVDQCIVGSTRDFWLLMAEGLRRKRMNWLYVRDLSRAMSLLHGWELIEEGIIKYQAACLQDPPLWVRCVIAGRPVMLCDSRNYGDDYPAMASTAEREREECAQWSIQPRAYWEVLATIERRSIREFVEPVYASIMDMGGCGWKPTISGLAWSLYRRHFIPETTDLWEEENEAAKGE